MNELTHKRPATKKDVREFMQMIKMSPQKYLAIHSRLTKLIENGADLNTQGYLGQTLLHVAIKIGDLRLLNMFLDANVNVDLANDFCESPIHKAVIAGKLKFVEALVEHGCDLHAGCEQDQTPLHLAVSGGYVDIVKYLVEKGADPLILDERNYSPIDYAIDEKDTKILEYFMSCQFIDDERREKINKFLMKDGGMNVWQHPRIIKKLYR